MSHTVQNLPTAESCSSQDVMAMIKGYWKTQAVYCMAKLGLADLLAEGPKESDALAQATETHPPSLYRLLRGLVSLGLLMQGEDGQRHGGLCLLCPVPGSRDNLQCNDDGHHANGC